MSSTIKIHKRSLSTFLGERALLWDWKQNGTDASPPELCPKVPAPKVLPEDDPNMPWAPPNPPCAPPNELL
jgi:hypothetical protein